MVKMEIENIKIGEIKPYENNPRKNDKAIDVVAKSIKEFGFQQPILLDKTNTIIAGHTRLKAAEKLNLKEVPIIRVEDLTPAQIKAFRIMDNKSQEYAEWDLAKLKTEFGELEDIEFDLSLTGFNLAEVTGIYDSLNEIQEDNFDVEKAIKNPKYKINPGEIWKLGNHRLICGDATKKEDVDKLMDGKKADICITDPPYSVNYKSRKEVTDQILDSYQDPKNPYELLKGFLSIIPCEVLLMTYTERQIHHLMKCYEELNMIHVRMLIWKKQHFTFHMGSNYHNLYEPIFIAKIKNAKVINNQDSKSTDVLEFDRKMKNNIHPTEKPLGLYDKFIKNHSNKGSIIYEPFAGSGTTLIASEQNDRVCYGMEISPQFCSVIIERWESLTQKKAEKSQ